MEFNKIYCMNCIPGMKRLDDDVIDMVVTSPPYNLGKDYGDRVDDNVDFDVYHKFAIDVMAGAYRVMRDSGRFCLEMGGSGRNFPLTWCWQDAAFKAGFGLYSEITITHRKTNECAWGSWLKADNVYTIPNFHMAYVFYKGSETKRGRETEITSKEFAEWTRGRWTLNFARRVTKHPAEYPVEIVLRFLKLFGHVDDVVMDPFMGGGTTAVGAKILNRKYIGFELNSNFINMAEKRLKQEYMWKWMNKKPKKIEDW